MTRKQRVRGWINAWRGGAAHSGWGAGLKHGKAAQLGDLALKRYARLSGLKPAQARIRTPPPPQRSEDGTYETYKAQEGSWQPGNGVHSIRGTWHRHGLTLRQLQFKQMARNDN